MKKLLLIPALMTCLLMSSCAFTNLFTKNLLDQRRRAFVGLSKIIFNEEGRMMGMSTASGAIIEHDGDKSYVLTAKHFCEPTGAKYIDQINVHTHKMENAKAEVVAMAKDIDACIISSNRLDAKKLSVANFPPEIGEKVYNMAAPQGVFGENLVMLYEGFYSGKLVEGPLGQTTADIFSLPANPGSSGSPVINGRGKLVGVVFAIHSRFHHITLSTPFEKMRSFIHTVLESKSE